MKYLEKTVDCYCYPMRVIEWSNRLRYSWFVAVRSFARILENHLSERGLYFHLNLRARATDWCMRFAGSRGERVSWVAGRANSCISLELLVVKTSHFKSRRQDGRKRSLHHWSNKSQEFRGTFVLYFQESIVIPRLSFFWTTRKSFSSRAFFWACSRFLLSRQVSRELLIAFWRPYGFFF